MPAPLQGSKSGQPTQRHRLPQRWTAGTTPGHDGGVGYTKLDSANAFVVTDLDSMPRHAGLARCAPKVLTDSTWLLARCATYQFASFDLDVGGASVGISAPADERNAAVAAVMAELTDAAAGGLTVDAGRGLGDADLAPLHHVDGRPEGFTAQRAELTGRAAAAAIEAVRPLDGATIALESLDTTSAAFATEAVRRGATVVGVGIGTKAAVDRSGIDPAALRAVLDGPTNAEAAGSALGEPALTVAELLATEVDVMAIGSKLGAVDHSAAASITAGVVAPTAWVPVTTRALAVLTRAGVTVLPDFVALAGGLPASGLMGEPVAGDSGTATAGMEAVSGVMAEVMGATGEQWPNAVLAGCARAEASLRHRGHDLPVSRPLG